MSLPHIYLKWSIQSNNHLLSPAQDHAGANAADADLNKVRSPLPTPTHGTDILEGDTDGETNRYNKQDNIHTR